LKIGRNPQIVDLIPKFGRPSSQDDNTSSQRYFLSLTANLIMKSTNSLAGWHQWSKSPILTQDFTIQA
jgi:hypothetical protein